MWEERRHNEGRSDPAVCSPSTCYSQKRKVIRRTVSSGLQKTIFFQIRIRSVWIRERLGTGSGVACLEVLPLMKLSSFLGFIALWKVRQTLAED